jgi:L-iditol 2-dehydrogenase
MAESLLDFLDERGKNKKAQWQPKSQTLKARPRKIENSRHHAGRGLSRRQRHAPGDRARAADRAGELLVKIATCGICGTDLKKIHTGSHSAPRIFGHEMAGTIVQVGEGVTKFAVGERVMVFHHVPCGECYYCRKQTPAQCRSTRKWARRPVGALRRRLCRVHSRDGLDRRLGGVVRIPDGVPFEQAAFMEPVNTVLKGVKLLNLAADETVLVIGQGPIG